MERGKEFGIRSDMLVKLGAHRAPMGQGVTAATEADRKALLNAVEKLATTRFKGGTERLAGTVMGQTSNLQDEIWAMKVAMGEALLPTFRALTPVVIQLANALKWIGESPAGPILLAVGSALGAIVSVGGTAVFALNQVREAVQAFNAWRTGGAAANVAGGGGGAANAAGGAARGLGWLGPVGAAVGATTALYGAGQWAQEQVNEQKPGFLRNWGQSFLNMNMLGTFSALGWGAASIESPPAQEAGVNIKDTALNTAEANRYLATIAQNTSQQGAGPAMNQLRYGYNLGS
jgi:hypothetical protein